MKTITKRTAQILYLPSKRIDPDLIETLEYLLQEARAGRVIGLAYAALLPEKKFFVDASGQAHTDPLRGLGAVEMLSEELRSRFRPV